TVVKTSSYTSRPSRATASSRSTKDKKSSSMSSRAQRACKRQTSSKYPEVVHWRPAMCRAPVGACLLPIPAAATPSTSSVGAGGWMPLESVAAQRAPTRIAVDDLDHGIFDELLDLGIVDVLRRDLSLFSRSEMQRLATG